MYAINLKVVIYRVSSITEITHFWVTNAVAVIASNKYV